MTIVNRVLPTQFAIAIAKSVDLYVDAGFGNVPEITKRHFACADMLVYFQQMAIGCDFESACVAYHGAELTDDQKTGLKLIHKSTNDWLLGNVIGSLLHRLEDSQTPAKEVKEIALTILESLIGAGSVTPEAGKRLIIKFADVEKEKAK
jgi:hypothetical protein